MNTSSINGLSANYIQATLAQQLTTNGLNKSSAKNNASSGQSEFSKLLSDLSNGVSSSTGSNPNNPSQLLNQMVSNFQVSGVANQGQSLDPSAIAA